MLPTITGEFGLVADPELRFNTNGKAWATLRCAFKDRKRDSMGNWSDGPSQFIDVIVNDGAENLMESVSKGDLLIISGRFNIRVYEPEGGTARYIPEIKADSIGPSIRWQTAKTHRTVGDDNTKGAADALGGQEIAAPF